MQRSDPACGSVILEFASILPFLIILLYGVFDIGCAIQNYFRAARIAYEGVRYASSLAGLDEGRYDFRNVPAQKAMQRRLHERIETLVTRNFDSAAVAGAYNFRTELRRVSTGALEPENLVTVELEVESRPLFMMFGALPVRVKASGPYLYRDRT